MQSLSKIHASFEENREGYFVRVYHRRYACIDTITTIHRKVSGEENIVYVSLCRDPCGGVLERLCVPYSASLLQAIRIE